MFDLKIEDLAESVRKGANLNRMPVDVIGLAEFEGIILQPVTNFKGFNGKIEFWKDDGLFVIFHPDPTIYEYKNRLRFSIAHELGHYHIEEHRSTLVAGQTHNSKPGFSSQDPREREADEFAAALLIPRFAMEPTIDKRGYLDLREIDQIAKKCEVSLIATAIRYVRMASEACAYVLSKDGERKSYYLSDEATIIRLGKIKRGDIPLKAQARLLSQIKEETDIKEFEHNIADWFESPFKSGKLYEQSKGIGQGYVVSMLSLVT